jgi:hypothetical protein
MDWSLVDTPVFERAHLKGSEYSRSPEEHRAWLAHMEADLGTAWHQHKKVKDRGRQWGMLEDWRKVSRQDGGHEAWKLLEAELRELQHCRARRDVAFDKTKTAIGAGTRMAQDFSSHSSGSRKVWDTRVYRNAHRKLDEANEEVKVQEDVLIDLMESKGLHLTLRDALEMLRPRMPQVPMDAEVENVREVLESVLRVLVDLTEHERTLLLLGQRLPQFSQQATPAVSGKSPDRRFRAKLGQSAGSPSQLQHELSSLSGADAAPRRRRLDEKQGAGAGPGREREPELQAWPAAP